jgi:integrase/recombinase XerD
MSEKYLIEAFIEMMAVERAAAANTLGAYERDLADYNEHLSGRGRGFEIADEADIRLWIGGMGRAGVKASTVARRLSAIRQFHKFLLAEGIRGDNPSGSIETPRLGRPLPKVMSEREVDLLLALAHEEYSKSKVMVREFALQGLSACLRFSTRQA